MPGSFGVRSLFVDVVETTYRPAGSAFGILTEKVIQRLLAVLATGFVAIRAESP